MTKEELLARNEAIQAENEWLRELYAIAETLERLERVEGAQHDAAIEAARRQHYAAIEETRRELERLEAIAAS